MLNFNTLFYQFTIWYFVYEIDKQIITVFSANGSFFRPRLASLELHSKNSPFTGVGGFIKLNFTYSMQQVKLSKHFLNQENFCKRCWKIIKFSQVSSIILNKSEKFILFNGNLKVFFFLILASKLHLYASNQNICIRISLLSAS